MSKLIELVKRIFKNVSYLLMASAVSNILLFFMAIVLINFCNKESFGLYKYYIALCNIVALVMVPGINNAITLSAATGHDSIIKNAVKHKIRFSPIAVIVFISIAIYFRASDESHFVYICLIGMVTLPFQESYDVAPYFLIGKKMFLQYFVFMIVKHVILVSVVISTMLLATPVYAICIAHSVSLVIVNMMSQQFVLRNWEWNEKMSKEDIAFGNKYSGVVFLERIRFQLDLLITGTFFSLGSVAVMAAGKQFYSVMKLLPAVTSQYTVANIAATDEVNARRIVLKYIVFQTLFFAPVVAALIALMPWIVKIFPESYKESAYFARIYMVAFFFIAVHGQLHNYFVARKKIAIQYRLTIMVFIASLGGLCYLGTQYGVRGLVMNAVWTQIFQLVVYFWYFFKDKNSFGQEASSGTA